MNYITAALLVLLILILVLPLICRKVEENIELFLFAMALIGGFITHKILNESIIEIALKEPLFVHGIPFGIFQAVLVFGIIAYYFKSKIEVAVNKIASRFSLPVVFGILTFMLSLLSSIISVIVASILLSEIALALNIERRKLSKYLVYSSFSLGIGAILTPIGEPLATIINSKLSSSPAYPGPLFLLVTFGPYVVGLCALFSFIAAFQLRGARISSGERTAIQDRSEDLRTVIIRALKVYIFVLALVILGESFSVLIEAYFSKLTPDLYYLIGSISSFIDNATLAAAMIGPELAYKDIVYFVLAMLIAGGFLVPGNIPNIIVSSRAGISFREWARHALRLGIIIYVATYLMLKIACLT